MRRAFHSHAEVGFTEFWTASHVVQALRELGYEVAFGPEVMERSAMMGVPSPAELKHASERAIADGADPAIVAAMEGGLTGVVATRRGSREGPTVAFRFDMDALPIFEAASADHEPLRGGYRSRYDGGMHACAHDGHTAIGLALAGRLAQTDLAGTLRLIFQPAEEGGRGARPMVAGGAVEGVDRLFCMHLGVGVPLGEVAGGSAGYLATTKMVVRFTGVPAHAGHAPEEGKNALLGAATALLNIHALPRFGTGDTRVNVGRLEGGVATNVIAQYARMAVETRATDEAINAELERRVRTIVEHAAGMHGLAHEVEVTGGCTILRCDEEMVDLVVEEARQVDGVQTAQRWRQAGGSEDASLLVKRVQEQGGKATYMVIGTTLAAPHHNDHFDIDEESLSMGVELLERVARRALEA